MSCSCKKCKTGVSCNRCNKCNDTGCGHIVYPECIITKSAYPCINVAAGKTGTVLFAAIDTAICALKTCCISSSSAITVIQGNILTIEGDILNIEEDIVNINNNITNISGCITDSTGGCIVDTLSLQITNIEGDISIIQNSIAIETWKTFDDAGDMDNGEPIPTLTPDTSPAPGSGVARLRADGNTHVEINLSVVTVVADTIQLELLTTLPIGYRPQVLYQFPITCTEVGDPASLWHGEVHIDTDGSVTLYIWDVIPPGDVNLVVNFFERFATD